jgi:hypothetical protein
MQRFIRIDTTSDWKDVGEHHIGQLSQVCQYCAAMMFPKERMKCCNKGKLQELTILPEPNQEIQSLFKNPEFLTNIRAYNSSFALASMGSNVEFVSSGISSFKISGNLCHLAGSLSPESFDGNTDPMFAQIYILDPDYQDLIRHTRMPNLNEDLLYRIREQLNLINPFVKTLRSAVSRGIPEFSLIVTEDGVPDIRRWNKPTAPELAAIIPSEGNSRKIVVFPFYGRPKRISEIHPSYDALHFVLLFPAGEDGWHHQLFLPKMNKHVTVLQFTSHRLQIRHNSFNLLFHARRLFEEYAVDSYAKIESERLKYLRLNQGNLRAEAYQGLTDALSAGKNLSEIGKRVILPASFIGSPRHFNQLYHDAMALVRHLGRPDFFITMTANPAWPEISEALFPGQQPHRRPDLIARVFKIKFEEFLHDDTKKIFLERCWDSLI